MKKSFGSIKWKLVLVYAALVVCVILVIGVYIIGNIQKNLYQSRYQEMKYTAGRINDTVELAYTSGEQELSEVFSRVVTSLLTEGGNEEGLMMYLLGRMASCSTAEVRKCGRQTVLPEPFWARCPGRRAGRFMFIRWKRVENIRA